MDYLEELRIHLVSWNIARLNYLMACQHFSDEATRLLLGEHRTSDNPAPLNAAHKLFLERTRALTAVFFSAKAAIYPSALNPWLARNCP